MYELNTFQIHFPGVAHTTAIRLVLLGYLSVHCASLLICENVYLEPAERRYLGVRAAVGCVRCSGRSRAGTPVLGSRYSEGGYGSEDGGGWEGGLHLLFMRISDIPEDKASGGIVEEKFLVGCGRPSSIVVGDGLADLCYLGDEESGIEVRNGTLALEVGACHGIGGRRLLSAWIIVMLCRSL